MPPFASADRARRAFTVLLTVSPRHPSDKPPRHAALAHSRSPVYIVNKLLCNQRIAHMEPYKLSGTLTYRSFINEPQVVGDFSKLQFAEAELTLFATLSGSVSGILSWPTNDDDSARAVMDINGQIDAREPLLVRLEGIGRKGSAIEAFDYRYELTLARHWPETTQPRTCLVGSVIRAKDHGTAKAGVTASVIAVRRDFVEPRDIPGVGLAPSTIAMLAGQWHRLWHATWHTLRGEWPEFRRRNDAHPDRQARLGGRSTAAQEAH